MSRGWLAAILVGLAAGPLTALLVAGVYFLISNVILNFVYPKVVGDAVRLPPILVIVAFIAGRPPWRCTTRCTIDRPTPLPSNSSGRCRRWKASNSWPA